MMLWQPLKTAKEYQMSLYNSLKKLSVKLEGKMRDKYIQYLFRQNVIIIIIMNY